MSSEIVENLADETYFILEKHASYFNAGKNDRTRFYVDGAAVELLAWLGIYIVLPILTGTVSNVLTNLISSQDSKKQHEEDQSHTKNVESSITQELNNLPSDLEQLKEKVQQAVNDRNQKRLPTEGEIRFAKSSLANILELNGWPKEYAHEDSNGIVLKVQETIWNDLRE